MLAAIEACVPLAPLHNPANLTGMRALAALAPDLPQYASFDTAFHATQPGGGDGAMRCPGRASSAGIRRYGFHGLSYAGLVRKLQETGTDGLPERLLALHLGNGASLCAIRDGRSVATTMGYSPLDGLTMGTRSGGIDGNAVLRLAELHGIEGAGADPEPGKRAVGAGRQQRHAGAARGGHARGGFAVEHFCYWADAPCRDR